MSNSWRGDLNTRIRNATQVGLSCYVKGFRDFLVLRPSLDCVAHCFWELEINAEM